MWFQAGSGRLEFQPAHGSQELDRFGDGSSPLRDPPPFPGLAHLKGRADLACAIAAEAKEALVEQERVHTIAAQALVIASRESLR